MKSLSMLPGARGVIVAVAALGALGLGACAQLQNVASQLPVEVATVQSATSEIAKALCGFEPTAATITGIVATLDPSISGVTAVATKTADLICAAVTAKSLARAAGRPEVNGVPVDGQFVPRSVQRAARHSLSVRGVTIEGRFVR